MRTERVGQTLSHVVVAALAVAIMAVWLAPRAQARPDDIAVQAIEGLDVEGTTTYRLDETAGIVHVRSQVTLTNTRPPENLGYATRSYFFDEFAVGALGPIASPRASRDGDGSSMSVRVEEPDAYVDFLVVDLSPNLTYGSPQQLVVEYDLPSQPNGSDSVTRVNDAFATWYVTSVGNDGLGDVVIDIPERFELEAVTPARGRTEEVDGRSITRYEDLTQADGFFGVSARDDDALVIRSTTVDDDDFEIQAWPGDEEWAEFAVGTVEDGIPALIDWVGLDIEGEREITVAESGTPYLYGYGGWYSPADDLVEIGDQKHLHTMLHELAHLWYHTELFSSRWVTEGLAELAASRAATAIGEDPLPVETLSPDRPGSQPLSLWDDVGPGAVSDLDDLYGYETSFALLSAITDVIGRENLRAVVARADAKDLPVAANGDTVRRRVHDWRYFYDLLLTTAASDSDAIDTLFDTYVWTDEDRDAIEDRRKAMQAYDDLAGDSDDWTPAVVVRKALADWDFDDATAAMSVAADVLTGRAELDRILAGTGVEATALQLAYEDAGSVAELERLLEDLPAFTEAARELAALDAELDGLDPIRRFGLLGRDVDGRQEDAEVAFAAGELGDMSDEIAGIERAVDQSVPSAVALVLVPAALPMLVIGGVALRRRRRRLWNEVDAPTGGV